MEIKNTSIIKLFFRLFVSFAILFWLMSRINLQKLFYSFSKISITIWIIAFLLYLVSQMISSFRWFIIGQALNFKGPFLTYLKYYFVGMFFNLFLPSAIGGDVLKIFFLSQGGRSRLKAGYSVFLDRAFGLWAMFLIGFLALTVNPQALDSKWRILIMSAAFGVSLLALSAPFFYDLAKNISNKIEIQLLNKIAKYMEMAFYFWKDFKSLILALGCSFFLQLCGMSAVYFLGQGLGLGLDISFYFSALPVISLLTILPISLSGLGVREGGFVYFLGLKGVSIEVALSLSLAFFAIQAVTALLGGLGYIAGVHKQIMSNE